MAVVLLSSEVSPIGGGHECTLSDEFLQVVEGDALHVECSS